MSPAPLRLRARMVAAQIAVGVVVTSALAGLGPRLLLLEPDVARAVAPALAAATVAAAFAALLATLAWLGRHRYLLRALAMGSSAVEPDDLGRLADLPSRVTSAWSASVGAAIALVLIDPIRPALVDPQAAQSLLLVGAILVAAAALPLHVASRSAVARALELAPPDAMGELIASGAPAVAGRRRDRASRPVLRMLAAVASPVGLVAFGAALVGQSHVRALDERVREQAAAETARASLEPAPGPLPGAGRDGALDAMARAGFAARIDRVPPRFAVERAADGRVALSLPLDDGVATVRFPGTTAPAVSPSDAAVALLALAIGAALALAVGRWLADDLRIATRGVRMIGTEDVLRGATRVARPARFAVVADLVGAVERLADRFRVFARAQERAIDAAEAARRTRSLLFASVSHDLRNPLNAILGFADLVGRASLTEAQRESLGVLSQRGRELLSLIETILGLARLEAVPAALARGPARVEDLVEATRRALEALSPERARDVEWETPDAPPPVEVDVARTAQALAAILGQMVRDEAAPGGARAAASVRAVRSGEWVCVEIADAAATLGWADARALLEPEAADPASVPPSSGRRTATPRRGGLRLALSLARSIAEAQGGRLDSGRSQRNTAAFRVWLPVRGSSADLSSRLPRA